MHIKALLTATLMLGITSLPTTFAQHRPCDKGFNHNAGTSCAHPGNYACSHNLKHLVCSLLTISNAADQPIS
jgi:hypothetical protein